MLKMKRALRRADDAARVGNYVDAYAEMDSIREYALTVQRALLEADQRRQQLESRTT